MKKLYRQILSFSLALLSMTGCGNDNEPEIDGNVCSPVFTANIRSEQLSRVVGLLWEEDDAIGISGAGRTNVCYTTPAGNGAFTQQIPDSVIFFQSSSSTDFYAYYPWRELPYGTTAIDINTEDQSKQNDFDYLGGKGSGSKTKPKVTFQFTHRMSKITLIFKKGYGIDLSRIIRYEIDGLKQDGTLKFDTDPTCSANTSAVPKPLIVNLNKGDVVDGEPLPSLIVLPQTATLQLRIYEDEDQYYICDLKLTSSDSSKLQAANNYQFTVTINKKSIEVESSIVDWTTETSDDNHATSGDDPE